MTYIPPILNEENKSRVESVAQIRKQHLEAPNPWETYRRKLAENPPDRHIEEIGANLAELKRQWDQSKQKKEESYEESIKCRNLFYAKLDTLLEIDPEYQRLSAEFEQASQALYAARDLILGTYDKKLSVER